MSEQQSIRLAREQLSALQQGSALLRECTISVRLGDIGTMIKDNNGTPALIRVPLLNSKNESVGFADIATAPELGSVLFSVAIGKIWDELVIRRRVDQQGLPSDGAFVAYDYPKIGLEVGQGTEGKLVYDWISGELVRPARPPLTDSTTVYSYSMIESLSDDLRISNVGQFEILTSVLQGLETESVALVCSPQKEIRYSERPASHPCFELRTQNVHEWCVPASIEMLLAFYRYNFAQADIAQAMGQEDANGNESELPTGKEYKVLEVISSLTRGALEPRMYPREGAFWEVITREIDANRPMILFTGGHARVVTGYSICLIGPLYLKSLTLYDPAETKVCWEYYNSNKELVLFSAALRHGMPSSGRCEPVERDATQGGS
jgi:hypothetical protein